MSLSINHSGKLSSVGDEWSCSQCTFLNHPFLRNCEICDHACVIIDHNEQNDNSYHSITTTVKSESGGRKLSNSSHIQSNNFKNNKIKTWTDESAETTGIMILINNSLKVMKESYVLCRPDCSHFTQKNRYGHSWSCGYRNIQMLVSSLMKRELFKNVLFNGNGDIPSIKDIQIWIEKAWNDGFDPEVSVIRYYRSVYNIYLHIYELNAHIHYIYLEGLLVIIQKCCIKRDRDNLKGN